MKTKSDALRQLPSLVEAARQFLEELKELLGGVLVERVLLYGGNGVFKWAPSLRSWLKNPEYVFWLGLNQLALKSLGYP
jgi:hypothetical protein